jgi:Xaa-Pro aminopeptidase
MKDEFLGKVEQIREIIRKNNIDGVVVSSQINFSWLTGGRGFVGLASEDSCASIYVSRDEVFLGANNIEAPRLLDEEMPLLAGVLPVKTGLWYEGANHPEDGRFVRDTALAGDFMRIRSVLNAGEIAGYRNLSRETAETVETVCKNLNPGVSEFETAGKISAALWALGIEPITLLTAFDRRISLYRHPLPTANTLEKYALIAVCARRHGLVASLTRLASLGAVSGELRRKHQAVTAVDACFIANSRPGSRAGEIFNKAVAAYESTGYADEWKNHHQGGMTGYSAREYIAAPETKDVVRLYQAFAWNPSITGTKSEDTILAGESGNEILTHTGGYEYIERKIDGTVFLRPDILIL